MKKIALDTNAYARLLLGDESVLDALANAESVYMPVIVLGELYAGFKGGSRESENRNRLAEFLRGETLQTLPVSPYTAEIFGEIKHGLKQAGLPIPINDVWIAALTIESGAYLVTFDAHFRRIPGLLLWPSSSDTGAASLSRT